MSGYSFAENWPGREAWGSESHGGPRGGRGGKDPRGGRHGGYGPRGHGHHGHGHHGHGRHEEFGRYAEAIGKWALAGKGRHRPSPEELEDLIALRRMGGGPFGGPGPFGRGPRGRGRGRGRARRGDVRLALLRLLAEEPRNGYQLMQTIEERSEGNWRPSPGSVYPTLSQLEDEGLIRSAESDGPRRFEITDAGREHLQTRAGEPDPWKPTDEESEHALSDIGPLVIQIGKAAWQVASAGDEAQRARAVELLAETRRGLYRILAEDSHTTDSHAEDSHTTDDDTGSAGAPGEASD